VKTPPPPEKEGEAAAALPGIPFFMKSAGCKHQTVWLQPVYTLSLSVKTTVSKEMTDEAKEPESDRPSGKAMPDSSQKSTTTTYLDSKVLSFGRFRTISNSIGKLRQLLSGAKPSPSSVDPDLLTQIKDTWDSIPDEAYEPFGKIDDDVVASNNVILVSNTIAPETYVDYTTTYYLNSSKPLAGSSQASFKLAEDGTLTEGAAQGESKTLQTFLDLVPFKDVTTKLATSAIGGGIVGFTAPKPGPPLQLPWTPPNSGAASYEFDFKVETKAYKRTHSAMVPLFDNQSSPQPKDEGSIQSQTQESSNTSQRHGFIKRRPPYMAPPCEFPNTQVTRAKVAMCGLEPQTYGLCVLSRLNR
jgi:hypothetical protein